MNNKEENNWNEKSRKKNTNHINRLREYFKDDKMNISENFDDFFHSEKSKFSKEDWKKLVDNFENKMKNSQLHGKPNMIVMFEGDYENLLEMRGFFKMNNKTEYVDTINKILNTMQPREI